MDARRKIRDACVVCSFVALFGAESGYAIHRSESPAGAAAQIQLAGSSVSTSYGEVWQTSGGYTTTLILKNEGTQSAGLQVQLYSASGSPAGNSEVQVAANSSARVSMSDLVPSGVGGLSVRQSGGTQPVSGQVVITDPAGSMASYPLQGGYRYDTEKALSAPWWLPDAGTDGLLTLFNSSAQSIAVSPSVTVGGVEKPVNTVVIAANATLALSLREVLAKTGINGASMGSVKLRYTGQAHALEPSLLLSNTHSGFALFADFNASHQQQVQQQTSWQYPYVPLSVESGISPGNQDALTAYALLSNGTRNQIIPQIIVYTVSGGKVVQAALTAPALAAGETRLLDLAQMTQQLPSRGSRLALTISHNGQPGDLGITIFSMNTSSQVVARSDGLILPTNGTNISYWDVSNGQVLLHRIESATGTGASTNATLYYQTQGGLRSYSLPTMTVSDDQGRVVNLTQLLRTGVPDTNGAVLRRGVTSGLVVLSSAAVDPSPVLTNSLATCEFSCNAQLAPTSQMAAAVSPVSFAPDRSDSTAAIACSPPGPPDHVGVLIDNAGYSAACPTTGVYVRQMEMQVLDANSVAINTNPSIVEAYQNLSANTCSSAVPQPTGCAATNFGTGAFLDTLTVNAAQNFCAGTPAQQSGCGWSQTSVWTLCGGSGSNTIWTSPRVTHSNGITVNGNSTTFPPGTILH